MSDKRCENCRWRDESSRCRRYPPILTDVQTHPMDGWTYQVCHGGWIVVNDNDWCGEWQPKESEGDDLAHPTQTRR